MGEGCLATAREIGLIDDVAHNPAVLKDESRSQIWSATMAVSLYELAGWLGEGAEVPGA